MTSGPYRSNAGDNHQAIGRIYCTLEGLFQQTCTCSFCVNLINDPSFGQKYSRRRASLTYVVIALGLRLEPVNEIGTVPTVSSAIDQGWQVFIRSLLATLASKSSKGSTYFLNPKRQSSGKVVCSWTLAFLFLFEATFATSDFLRVSVLLSCRCGEPVWWNPSKREPRRVLPLDKDRY